MGITHPVLLQVSLGRRLLSQPTPSSSLSPFSPVEVTTPLIYQPTCSGNCCLNRSAQIIQVKAQPLVWHLEHWMRVQLHTRVCWQTGGRANHPAERQGTSRGIPAMSQLHHNNTCGHREQKCPKYFRPVAQREWCKVMVSWQLSLIPQTRQRPARFQQFSFSKSPSNFTPSCIPTTYL